MSDAGLSIATFFVTGFALSLALVVGFDFLLSLIDD